MVSEAGSVQVAAGGEKVVEWLCVPGCDVGGNSAQSCMGWRGWEFSEIIYAKRLVGASGAVTLSRPGTETGA